MKALLYVLWFVISLPALAILRNIARSEAAPYSPVIMGVAFAVVIYAFFWIRNRPDSRKQK
jgi:hypothetical protein